MTETEKTAQGNTTAAAAAETETDTPKADNEHQRKINVGNLPSDVTEQQLRDHFTGHDIQRVDIYHYRKNTLALLLFKDKEAAVKAITDKDGSMFQNRRLRIHLEYLTIRHIKRDVIVTVLEDENTTEEQLWDKVKAAVDVEPTSILTFYPLAYIALPKDSDKTTILEKLNTAGFNAHDVNQRDQNQHLDIWRAAKLFHRNRNRVQLLNIPNKWIEDKEEMKKQCAEGGTITEAVSNNTNQNQNASNYARIFYETEEQAIKASAALNGRVVDGKRIHALHLGSALIPNYKTSVYVTSLDKGITEEQVFDHFKQFGDIDFVNRRNCNDAAIICFKSEDAVEKALACTSFPAPTDDNKEATKDVTVKKYNGPLVLRPQAVKRKLKSGDDDQPADNEQKTKEREEVLKKLQSFHPVFVGNVPLDCPPLELKRYFSQHGPIKFMFSPQILPYRTSAPHPVKTFIIYYNLRNSATNACKTFDHKFFGGHRLHVLPLRGTITFDQKKTVKMTKIPYLSEDALFKKIKPFVGKINRIVKKSRLAAYIELNDPADVEKLLKTDCSDHPLPSGNIEIIDGPVNVRLYDESDPRVLGGIAKIVSNNPDMLKKTQFVPMNKRPRLNGPGFNQGPGGFNSNNNMGNPQAIQDLLRLAFMSGKNVGESLASNQSSFNAPDPPLANSNNFGDGGFGNRNRNNQGSQGNFRGQGRNMNQSQNNRGNNFGNNNSGGGNNFQNAPGNQNRGGQNVVNRGGNQLNQPQNRNNMNQNQGTNRMPQNKQQGTGGNMNMNLNRNNQGGGNMNRNQNPNQNRNQNNRSFDNDSFGGGNNFGNNRNNNFANDNFNNDNFGNNRNDNFSNDNFSGNNRNFGGGNNRNQNDNFNSSFGSGGSGGGNNRFSNNDSQFSNNFNRNQNNRNFDDDNNFGGNNQKSNFNPNRQNKQFNNSGNNQGGGMSFGEFNSNTSSNNRSFGSGGGGGGNNSNFSGNAGNKWNSQQSNTGSRLAGSIFSRRF